MGSDWSDGYVRDVGYTFGYYVELHPNLLKLACLDAGLSVLPAQDLNYLELGFGHGLSLNIHAAGLDGTYWGTDFNPDHVGFARSLAQSAGTDARLLDLSFAELAERKDLPEFDVIALHGIWTWVSDDSRRAIVDIVRRRLKVGGILYNSYNCRPGWSPAEPLRHLMTLYGELGLAPATGTLAKVDAALAFCQRLADAGALYFQSNPLVGERLKKVADTNKNYVAHEYFNRNWELMNFSQMVDWLAPARVTYATSAFLLDRIDSINLPQQGLAMIADIRDPVLRETVRDYFVNQQFRRDIFVKGAEKLLRSKQVESLMAQSFVLLKPASDVPMSINGALGEATLQESIYRPLIEVLSESHYEPKTLARLAGHPQLKHVPFPQLTQAILVLVGAGHAFPASNPTSEARRRCAALNRRLSDFAPASADISFLASPVTGSGVVVDRMQQLYLRALADPAKDRRACAIEIWQVLSQHGQAVVKDGKPVDNHENAIEELHRRLDEFSTKRLSFLNGLGVEVAHSF